MATAQIIDIDTDPDLHNRPFRRWLWRFGAPIGGIIVIFSLMAGIYVHDYYSDREDLLALSNDLIEALDGRVRAQVINDLTLARSAASITAGLSKQVLEEPGHAEFAGVAMRAMRTREQFANFYIGFPDGEFLIIERHEDGSLATRYISRRDGKSEMTLQQRNADGKIIGTEALGPDPYDPRDRPWFQGAAASDRAYWTDVYVYFRSRQLGITVAKAARDPAGEVIGVVGVDLSLASLSHLIGSLQIGKSGVAMIVDEQKRVIAFPDTQRFIRHDGESLEHLRLDQLGDPVLTELYDRLRISGPTRSVVTVDGDNYIVSTSSLKQVTERPWNLVFIVPEADFTGFFEANSRTEILWALFVGTAIIAVILLLSYQRVQTERRIRIVERRQREIERQRAAFEEIASAAATLTRQRETALHDLTEIAARALVARRVSIWRLEPQGSGIDCRDCFDSATGEHTAGFRILESECPALFTALLAGEDVRIENAGRDERAKGLDEAHLQMAKCNAMASVPVHRDGHVAGFVWVEHTTATADQLREALTLARALAHVIEVWITLHGVSEPEPHAQTRLDMPVTPCAPMPAAEPVAETLPHPCRPQSPAAAAAMHTTSLSEDRDRQFRLDLNRRGIVDERLGATPFLDVSVLILRVDDAAALAERREGKEDMPVFQRLVDSLDSLARDQGIPYLKVLGDTVVAATGFDGDPRTAASALCHFALDAREAALRAFSAGSDAPPFAAGLDTGPAFGWGLATQPANFNLWGSAVRLASAMADTARPGTIQVTEAAREFLLGQFILRRRGGFHVMGIGDVTTYALGARL